MASKRNSTLYIGATNDIKRRVYEHKTKGAGGFTKKYDVASLVYFETYLDVSLAIAREKQMKKWNRAWKIREIEKINKDWKDLYDDL